MENVNATHLALDITSEGLEWGLMRTASGALHQVNFSGAYWTNYLLDAGPVGEDFELEIDDQGLIHILYTRSSVGEVVLLRINGSEHELRILATDTTIVDGIGMGLDDQNIEQVATMTQSGNDFSINLIRSLAGQDSGRVNPTPTQIVTGQDDVSEGEIKFADLNHDGYDDLIIATPQASLLTYVENGRVEVYYGSSSGVAEIPDMILAGEDNGSHFGAGLDTGDFNHDGIQDLAVGLPGWNPTNDSNHTHGQVHVYLGNASGISSTPWWSVSGSNGERLGSYLSTLMHDGQADMLAAAAYGFVSGSGTSTIDGKVNVYDGGESNLSSQRNLTASKNGDLFGRSIEGCDINGDGHEELIISNVGTYTTSPDYSSIEYFSGMSTGYNGTPDHTLETNIQGRLFGHTVHCVGDVQGDGFADHIITEPFNGTETFGGGKLWMYNGGDSGYQNGPNWTLVPTAPNSRIGEAIVSAGDINEDGFGDVYISSLNGDTSGKVEIYLGSASGLQSESQLLAQGTSNQKIGQRMVATGDLNGDGLGEMVFSSRNSQQGTSYGLEYHILSERDWESISFAYTGTAQGLDLATAHRGETSIVFTFSDNTGMHLVKLEHMNDQTPSGQWVVQSITEDANMNTTFIFKARSTGQPVLVTQDESAIHLHTTRSMTAVQQNVASTGTVGQYLGSTIDQYGKQAVAYTTGAGQQIFYSAYDETNGWTSEMVRNSVILGGNISVQVNSTDVPHLIYRHDDTDQLALASRDSSWTLGTLGEEGEAVSSQHPTMMLANDDLIVALVTQDDGADESNLSLWSYDGVSLSKSLIANGTDPDVQIEIAQLVNGSIIVAVLTNDGTLSVHEQWPGDDIWNQHTVAQPSGIAGEFRLDLEGGASPMLAVRGNTVSSLMSINSTGHWVTIQERPAAAVDGAWDILHTGTHLLMLTSDPVTHHLIVNTAELNGVHSGFAPWMSVQFGDVVVREELNAKIDANGTVHMAYWDTVNDDVIILRLYEDQDRDLVFDLVDAMPTVGDQWMNTDGDNHGDNPLGPLPDACPTTSGLSSYIIFGCEDYDADGYKDSIDGCDDAGGTSWIDRYGCEDLDQDGWSDNDATYYDGDQFKSNWKQALDTDGDGFGDNHGVDCCSIPVYDPNAGPGDLFPYLASQYEDFDGDGYGDNDADNVHGDYCPWDYGVSWRDRNGCLDSDGDGSSDVSDVGSIFEWNITNGADVWPFDATQWVDSDGDGFGDNDSENATNPDHFRFYPAAANDTDGDGFPDNWTALYNGSNGMGLKLDGCVDIWGNSTRPVVGCLDSDGDSYTDIYSYDLNTSSGLRENQQGDAFPYLDSQWLDTDGDGFGDQLAGFEGDDCPTEAGVLNGTNGIGCRLIDVADSDGDGVINDLDTSCPNTPANEPVNSEGCAQSELDDDDDDVNNNLDLCPSTPTGVSVDTEGCSLEQRTSDTDGDGINDPEDTCPATPSGETVDTNGCAESQRDSDGDGLSDLDDACDDTPVGFPILDNGCTDESALDTDIDGDGYSGMYAYDV
ncbi:MAG: FG-GAP-like repeat-containing protein, partial [Candidatus Poseidonia sp.]|nr:FG-GAP-like repeat-containing protein [Poseidonia sp.]